MSPARTLATLALAFSAVVSSPRRVHAEDWLPLSDSGLKAIRGGFLIGGVQFDFGAVLSTYVGGQLALQTTLNWTPDGVVASASSPDAPQKLSPDQAAAALASLGLSAKTLSGAVVLKGAGGVTALVQQADARQLTSLIANTADGQSVRQDTTLTLTLPGFQAVQAQYGRQLTASSLVASINQALRTSTNH